MSYLSYKEKFQNTRVIYLICATFFICEYVYAKSEAFEINYLHVVKIEDELRLDAEIAYALNNEVKEALVNGIEMIFQVEVQIKSKHKWFWDKTISSVTQNHTLKYHALSKQYLLENMETRTSDTFPDLESALRQQGKISAMYISEIQNLDEGSNHIVQIRSHLLTDKLPLPLKMKSYFSKNWRLSSGWYIWPL